MGRITSITAACCAATLLMAAPAPAQPANKLTYVTFSGPVSLPGTTLPAGTYAFRLADSVADRHIVHVFNRDETKLFTTLLAVPAKRNQAEGDPVVTFAETPSDRPPAVRYWYYAGEKSGNEFVYPKHQAMMIARASGEGVMSVDTDSTSIDDWKKGTPTRVTATAEPSATSTVEPAQPPAPTTPPATAPTTTAPEPTPAPQTATPPMISAPAPQPEPAEPVGTSGRAEPSELPRTASQMPAVGLMGLLALGGALIFRVARRSMA